MAGDLRSAALWRQDVFARAEELEMLTRWMAAAAEPHLVDAVEMHLAGARDAARPGPLPSRLSNGLSGASIQRAKYNLDAAEVNLLRLAPLDFLESNLPNLVAAAAEVLPAKDPRLIRLIQLDAPVEATGERTPVDRSAVVAAISAAKKAALEAQSRVRAFRNVLLVATALALLIGFALATIGLFAPETIPLCQATFGAAGNMELTCPASGSAPQPADTLIVQFAGVMGATVAAVFALRKVRGTTDPYSVPVALALLKLPTGALTAVLGLLMIRGGFVPGFTGLDSAAQVIGWAIIFGYAQELFTAVVDRQAANVLAASPSSDSPTDRPLTTSSSRQREE